MSADDKETSPDPAVRLAVVAAQLVREQGLDAARERARAAAMLVLGASAIADNRPTGNDEEWRWATELAATILRQFVDGSGAATLKELPPHEPADGSATVLPPGDASGTADGQYYLDELASVLAALSATPAERRAPASEEEQRLLALILPDHNTQRSLFGTALATVPATSERLVVPATVPEADQPNQPTPRGYPWVLALYAAAIVVYVLLRFRGHYVDQDTAAMTQIVEAVARAGTVIPGNDVRPVYPSGFGFQAVNVTLMDLTGLSIQTLEEWIWPFLLLGLGLLGYLTFQEITQNSRAALIAGFILFMQPDFLFTALRGSHEKMTYCLLLAALLLLFRSYRHRNRLSAFAGYVGLFYVVLAAVICTNSTFGSSLVVAISASFFGGFFVSRIFQPGKVTTNRILLRLAYASSSSFLVLYLVLFYFYPPSQAIFDQFQTAMARIAALALSFEATDHPYSYIAIGWRSPLIYLMLTAFTWVVLATSGLAWLRQTVTMLRDGWAMAPAHARLRWLLYAGLALQVGIGVLADFSGVLGSNLQLRLFPVFMFLAIPTASLAVVDVLKRLDGRPALRTAARLTLSVFAVCFGAFSVLKATNEPLLSNKWVFYSTPEAQTLDWLQVHMPSTPVWTDVDERLREVYLFRSPPTEDASVRFPTNKPADQLPVVMLSQITRDRLAQMRIPEPDLLRTDVVYDNGLVKLYRYPPRTSLQR